MALWDDVISNFPQAYPPHPSLPQRRNASPCRARPVRVPTALANSRCWARHGTR
ncbi:hypothetical protein K523DRAFT_380054, partial [Schizophyllum commune Tattone D]